MTDDSDSHNLSREVTVKYVTVCGQCSITGTISNPVN